MIFQEMSIPLLDPVIIFGPQWVLLHSRWKHGNVTSSSNVFPWFPMCSYYVPFKFSKGSHQVFQYVPKVPNVFPNMSSIGTHFYSICFGKCCPPFTYIAGPKGRNFKLQNRTFYFGESLHSLFFE